MKQNEASKVIEQYIDRIYMFVKRRVSSESDAQDISQETALKLYKILCVKDVDNVEAYVFTVARNTLINYYRGKEQTYYNVPIEDVENTVKSSESGILEDMIHNETCNKIRDEIAYLSKIQRKILIMFYYEKRKQSEIAEILDIPLGTVKWHLNDAKSQLKKGMDKMRNKDLKFNPITFSTVGLSGGAGEIGDPHNFVKGALSQNILYCIKEEYMTVEQIADCLGVSPVYVESELEYLEEYQLVLRKKDSYICNIVIYETSKEDVEKQDSLYSKIADKMTSKLYNKLVEKKYLESSDIIGPADENYRMWAIIFYLLSTAKSEQFEEKISFDEAAILRADGGKNIITAEVVDSDVKVSNEYFCGPCWNDNEDFMLWLIDGEWSEKRVTFNYGGKNIEKDFKLLKRFLNDEHLSVDEYTYMLEKGYIRHKEDGFELAIVGLKDGETKKKMLEETKVIKDEVFNEFKQEIADYKECKKGIPKNIKIQIDFMNQYILHSDGIFLRYCKNALVKSNMLKEIPEQLKISVSQLLIF